MLKSINSPPALKVQSWLNTEEALSLEALKGKVVVIYAFQMLCPSCILNSIPQARRISSFFSKEDLVVIGLHSVFEHHAAMTEVSLKAFLHEFRVGFPVAIDMPSQNPGGRIPQTMDVYQLEGTPSLILIDRQGNLRKIKLGHEEDLVLGAELMSLIRES